MSPVDTDPNIHAMQKVRITMVTVLSPMFPFHPHPLPHCNGSGPYHAPVTQGRVDPGKDLCLLKEDRNALPCEFLGLSVL
jgi:hypothetical protein